MLKIKDFEKYLQENSLIEGHFPAGWYNEFREVCANIRKTGDVIRDLAKTQTELATSPGGQIIWDAEKFCSWCGEKGKYILNGEYQFDIQAECCLECGAILAGRKMWGKIRIVDPKEYAQRCLEVINENPDNLVTKLGFRKLCIKECSRCGGDLSVYLMDFDPNPGPEDDYRQDFQAESCPSCKLARIYNSKIGWQELPKE
jgi:hypothetical protein